MMLTCLDGTLRSVNRLAEETSPYLRQHSENPVDWYPWGDEAFAAARRRNVPILLSVGYSACHWCHVMAHECFEDTNVAARMNELFVNVKVDREERPDVDQLYMDAVQALTGKGGWPMTVFLTPDAKPFYGGTYFPRDSFIQLLEAVDEAYRDKPAELEQNTDALMKAIEKTANLSPADGLPTVEQINHSVQTLARAFDQEWGGFGTAPKFPSTFHIELILRAYMTSGSEAAKTVVTTTLDAMAAGGIYDHVGGGFARYSTDREWLVPHFEKMLSDQALLVQTYLHALVVLREPQWRFVVQDTIEYVLNTLPMRRADSSPRRTPTPPMSMARASRGCSLPGHPMKCGRRSRTRDPTSSTLYLSIGTSPTMATSRPKTDLGVSRIASTIAMT